MHTSSRSASATSISPAAMDEKYGSETSRSATPIIVLWPVATALACRFAVYPSSPAALWTRSASCWPTRRAPSFRTREAVVSETPARSATSCSVTRCRSGRTSVTGPPLACCSTAALLDRLCRPAYSRESPFPNGTGGLHFSAEGGSMTRKVIQVALNGVTGRMGYRQHLVRSLLAIREQGGIRLDDGTVLYPEPILVGRSEDRLRAIAERHGLPRWTTSLDEVLGDPDVDVYFDTQVTSARETALARAIAAGKHVYTEKPLAATAAAAFDLAEAAKTAGITHGIVQDKLFLPGVIKLRRLVREGFFGRVLSVRLEFGYWVFDGDGTPAQRPSWNYRAEDGGGIVLDMFPPWHYLLDGLFAPGSSGYARKATHLPKRWDEAGEPYEVTADDAAYAILEFASGAIASVNSSWAVRVNRRELLEIHVDGTHGSAVAGLRNCAVQHKGSTPMPVWNPDLPDPLDYQSMWTDVPDNAEFDNGFKAQWEQFLRAAALGTPFRWDLFAGARGVQLAELALRSSDEGRRVEIPV